MDTLAAWYVALGEVLEGDPFGLLLEYVGTFAGAISGVRMASVKRFDWFGAFVVGLVTALGGGTLRDMLMNITPFWMTGPSYIVTIVAAVASVSLFGRRFISERITWFVFDTISIALFTVFGVQKALLHGFDWWCAVMMGVTTAVFGGVLRDIMINEVPLIFRKELYAMACMSGAVLYVVMDDLGANPQLSALGCIALIFFLRAMAIRYHLSVPVLRGHNHVHLGWHHNHPMFELGVHHKKKKEEMSNETRGTGGGTGGRGGAGGPGGR